MRKVTYLLSLGLALGLTSAAQTSGQTQPPPVNPTTPANQVGSGAQNKAGTPLPSSPTSPGGQVTPSGTQAGSGTQAPSPPAGSTSTGGVAGSASSSATQTPATDASAGGVAAMTDADLETQIQSALSKEPTLTGDSAHAAVAGDTIELTGNVNTSKEKLTATRIVQSFAGNKKVVNHLTVSSHAGKTSSGSETPATTTNPASNPEPSKGNPPTTSKPPLG